MTTVDQLGLDLGARLGLLLRRAYLLAMPAAYADVSTALGLDLAFDLANPLVQEVLGELATRVADIADTTRADIRALVGRQAAEGWSGAELARQIEALGEIRARQRAVTISRTEPAHAYGAAQVRAYTASGVVRGTEIMLGPNPCPICQGLVGKVVPLGEEYLPGVRHTPIHPLCTCDTVAVLK